MFVTSHLPRAFSFIYVNNIDISQMRILLGAKMRVCMLTDELEQVKRS